MNTASSGTMQRSSALRFALLALLALGAWWLIWGRQVRFAGFGRAAAAPPAAPIRGTPIDSSLVVSDESRGAASVSESRDATAAAGTASGDGPSIASDTLPGAAAADEHATAGGYRAVSFDLLAGFPYASFVADEAGADELTPATREIPAEVQALHNRKVDVTGFMIPIELEKDRAKSFLLVKDRLICCFGRMPKPNEWIFVEMTGGATADMVSDVPATVRGTIEVREEIRDGVVMGLYNMRGENVTFGAGF